MWTSFGDTKWRGAEELSVFKIFAKPRPTPTALPTALPAGGLILAGVCVWSQPPPPQPVRLVVAPPARHYTGRLPPPHIARLPLIFHSPLQNNNSSVAPTRS